MPRTTKPENYPAEYTQIVMDCGILGKSFRLPAVGPMPADSARGLSGLQRLLKLRGHFYSFIGAVKRSTDPKWAQTAAAAGQTVASINKEECALYFGNREQSWQAQAFKTIGEVKAAPGITEPAIETSLRKVIEALDSGDKP